MEVGIGTLARNRERKRIYMRKEKQKKRRSIADNFLWTVKLYEKYNGRKLFVYIFLYIVLAVIAPFISMAFPGMVVGILESGLSIGKMLGLILLYAIVIKIFNTTFEVVKSHYNMGFFIGRLKVAKPFYTHMARIDFEKSESTEGRSKKEKAFACLFMGDEMGIEYYFIKFPIALANGIGILIYSLIVVQISPWILLYMLVSAVFLAYLGSRRDVYEKKKFDETQNLYAKEDKVFRETLERESRHDILMYQAKEWMLVNVKEVVKGFENYFRDIFKIFSASWVGTAVLNFVRDLVVYGVLIAQVADGKLTVAQLLLYIGAIAGYSAWVEEFMAAILVIMIQNESVSDYRDYLEYGKLEERTVTENYKARVGKLHEISLKDVYYRYDGNDDMTLKNINLTIWPGEKVALVGENGAGKTTLVKLITGLYTPTKGTVCMDGMDVAAFNKEAYFKEMSVVFQDSYVIATSVAENVACSMEYDEERVVQCLKDAGLYEKVQGMKDGIHTMLTRKLDPSGVEFSGGETQKLMLARALYQNASILILDEPTAALDPLAESAMYERYTSFGSEKTSLFISHRLSSTRFCDRICFMKDGEITEEGTHEELMALGGNYAHMFEIQSKYYKEQEEKEDEE